MPSAFVDDVVVPGADGHHVREVGESAEFPGDDVVDVAFPEPHVTARESATAIDRPEGSSLFSVGVTHGASEVERVAVGVHDDRGDTPVAQEALHRCWWEHGSV